MMMLKIGSSIHWKAMKGRHLHDLLSFASDQYLNQSISF